MTTDNRPLTTAKSSVKIAAMNSVPKNHVVSKFGGTSLADAVQIRKVADIVNSDPRRRFVVVSAPGKRNSNDQKVTDLLLTCWHLASQKLDYQQPLRLIRERYDQIALDLHVEPVSGPLHEMQFELSRLAADDPNTLATRDWMAARGEYFHACLVAEFLEAQFVPAGDCIRFDADGQLDPSSYDLLAERMSGEGRYVVPGFYGRDVHGHIKTFPRGGSDITGAVVARAVGAEIYENWTDVSGLLAADPRIIPNPRPIAEVTYRELRELAYAGASVLHEETIFPASQAGIPIQIKNTNMPDDPGTRIVANRDASQDSIVGIAGKIGFTTIYMEKSMMNMQHGFGRRVLEVLDNHNISFEHMPSGIDSMSVVVADEQLQGKEQAVKKELQQYLELEKIEIIGGLALIATVGEGMAYRVGVAGTLFDSLYKGNVNVRMISQGASEINIIVGVQSEDYQSAVEAIYGAFAK